MKKPINYTMWFLLGANIGSFLINGLIALLGANLPYSAWVTLFSAACSVLLAVAIIETDRSK